MALPIKGGTGGGGGTGWWGRYPTRLSIILCPSAERRLVIDPRLPPPRPHIWSLCHGLTLKSGFSAAACFFKCFFRLLESCRSPRKTKTKHNILKPSPTSSYTKSCQLRKRLQQRPCQWWHLVSLKNLLTFITRGHCISAATISSCIPQPPTVAPLVVVGGHCVPAPSLSHSSTHHSTWLVPFHLLCSSPLKSSTSFINSLCTEPPGPPGSPGKGKCVWTLASVPRS